MDILDEMNICGIARYTFVPIAWYEDKMVETAAGITPTTPETTEINRKPTKRWQKTKMTAPSFDDIVFEDRNKEYGAYKLRKKYNRTVVIALMIGIIIISTAIITPYLNAKAAGKQAEAC